MDLDNLVIDVKRKKNKYLSQKIGQKFKLRQRTKRRKSKNYKKQKHYRNCYVRQSHKRQIDNDYAEYGDYIENEYLPLEYWHVLLHCPIDDTRYWAWVNKYRSSWMYYYHYIDYIIWKNNQGLKKVEKYARNSINCIQKRDNIETKVVCKTAMLIQCFRHENYNFHYHYTNHKSRAEHDSYEENPRISVTFENNNNNSDEMVQMECQVYTIHPKFDVPLTEQFFSHCEISLRNFALNEVFALI